MTTTDAGLAARAPSGPLFPIAAAMLLASLGISAATVALPTLARSFSAPLAQVQWVVLGYLLAVTACVVIAGRIGDLLGRRRILLAGLAIFALGSALCAAAPTLAALVAARVLQGVGGAILMSLPLAIARDTAGDRTGFAMGLLGTTSAVGTALGPSLGGLVIEAWGWRAVFVVLALAALGALAAAAHSLPVVRGEGTRGPVRLDLPGAALLAFTLVAFSLAATGGGHGIGVGQAWLLPLTFLGAMLFVAWELRAPSPLVEPAALLDHRFSLPLVTNLVVAAVMMSTLVVGPMFLAFGLGFGEAQVGLVMSVGPIVAALSGVPAGRFADRFGAARIAVAGLVQTCAGLIALALLPHALGAPGYVVALVLLTPGFQLFLAGNNAAVMVSASEGQRGVASGLLGLSRNLGFMIGASLAGVVFSIAAGAEQIAQAKSEVVGRAFSATFMFEACLILVAIVLAIGARTRRRADE
ncbi:MFS transporter [Limibaculum sp. M0105]|uniref:MFS transporter n=1 Tax=Thermohalobaculum xanthum TaxID=2753746 RepID=A0A8J7M6A9_9RHOB|nr:MFS transporter [Thermohalobaculum xanthum]MBK0399021.1 MFS transporter [Thermohalobaculum xanthum]